MRSSEQADETRVRELLRQAGPRPELPREELRRLESTARAAWRREVSRRTARRRRVRVRWALAAAAAVAVATALVGWRTLVPSGMRAATVATLRLAAGQVEAFDAEGSPRDVSRGGALVAGTEIRTAEEAEAGAELLMAGTASVRLDAGTRLRLVSRSELELDSGAVYVDSGRSRAAAGEPLTVGTPLGEVREIGTRFEVRLLDSGDAALRVRVRDGAVEVARGQESHRAGAGEELRLDRAGAVVRARAPAFGAHWGWIVRTAPPLAIEGMRLSDFLDRAALESGWRLEYADAELAAEADEVILHGPVDELVEGLDPGEAVSILLAGSGLENEVAEGRLLVRRRDG